MKELHFKRRDCGACGANRYVFIVQREDGPEIIEVEPTTTVSELQNRL